MSSLFVAYADEVADTSTVEPSEVTSDKKPDEAQNDKYVIPDMVNNADKDKDNVEDAETTVVEDKTEKDNSDASLKYNKIYIDLKLIPRMRVIDSFAKLEICTKDDEVIEEKVEWVGGITERLSFEFTVPEYSLGETFILKLKGGLRYIKYYDDIYGTEQPVKLDTYGYTNDNGEFIVGNSFALDGCPEYEHAIVTYVEGKQITLSPYARLINNIAMVPVRPVAEALGLDVRYDERYNSVVCEIGDKQAIFNVGMKYATLLGKDTYLSETCTVIGDTVFVPVRSLAETFGSEVKALDFDDHIDVCVGESSVVREYMQQIPVNRWGISSRTPYLVWVDKSDFRVRVYMGSQYKWKQVASFPCAIGAPGTPTITGSFEYQYRVSSWDYPGYYVGPCLVFYGGYALHSTLLQYNGVPYDNRVGVMISHGCVRLHKSDIDWIASRLPIGSRIYVTE